MSIFQYNIEELEQLGATAASLQYRTDAADELTLSVIPVAYGEAFPWQSLDRVELFAVVEGLRRCVFSGVVPMRGGVTLSGGAAPAMQLRACSDYYLLGQTVYAKVDQATGTAMAERDAELVQVGSFALKIFDWASGWSGSALSSALSVEDGLGTVPAPVSSGATSCAAMLEQALQWQPDALFCQRYDAESGHRLRLCRPTADTRLTLHREEGLTDVAVTLRTDLVPPVCALVGAVHAVWPTRADVREPGAFVYAVPRAADAAAEAAGAGSGGSPKGQKMEVRGYRLPRDFRLSQRDENASWVCKKPTAEQNKFVLRFFPQLAPLLGKLLVSEGYVLPIAAEDTFDTPEAGADGEEQEPGIPANYDTQLSKWEATGVFIHTSGEFPAAVEARKNVSGLKWCKAQLVLDVALKEDAMADMSTAEKAEAERLLPGTRAVTAEGEKLRRWATLRLSCNLINRSRKLYSTADNKLLSSDPDFNAEQENEQESARAATYRAAMAEYYRATRTVWSEGSVGLHFNGSRNPADMTGRLLHVAGLSPAWEQMNAIIRAVSWDVMGGALSVEFGTREVLGFSERLERRNMARAATQAPQRRETMGADAMDAEADAEQEAAMTVAADVATEVSAGVNGARRKPFCLYCEGGKHYYTGGIFTALGHSFEVPHTQYTIKHGEPTSTELTGQPVKLRVVRVEGSVTYNLIQKQANE